MAWWHVQGEAGDAARRLLTAFLEQGLCDLVAVPQVSSGGDMIMALVSDPARLTSPVISPAVMMVNSAQALSQAISRPDGPRIAAVLRSCEARALVELVKLRQAQRDRVILIGTDCAGTMAPLDYRAAAGELGHTQLQAEFYRAAADGRRPDPVNGVRPACSMCTAPSVASCDVRVSVPGDGTAGLLVELGDHKEISTQLKAAPAEDALLDRVAHAVSELSRAGEERKRQVLDRYRQVGFDTLLDALSGCVRCLNCRRACPICYCRECAFETMLFEHEPEQYRRWAERKGAVRLPANVTLFHLTRMNHVGTSCVGCGLCEMACPNGVALTELFIAAASDIQSLFDYEAGADPQAPLPYTTFRETELDPR